MLQVRARSNRPRIALIDRPSINKRSIDRECRGSGRAGASECRGARRGGRTADGPCLRRANGQIGAVIQSRKIAIAGNVGTRRAAATGPAPSAGRKTGLCDIQRACMSCRPEDLDNNFRRDAARDSACGRRPVALSIRQSHADIARRRPCHIRGAAGRASLPRGG